jgi:hypothetical protein
MTAEDVLLTPQLQASFEDRAEISNRDYAVMKALGLKFRGRQAWPQFRNYAPGWEPWYLNSAEAAFLQLALEQLLIVAPRFAKDPAYLPEFPGETLLFRVPGNAVDGNVVWHDEIRPIPEPVSMPLTPKVDRALLNYINSCPRVSNTFDVGLMMLLGASVGDRGQRGFFPFNLMVVESQSGFIVGAKMLAPEPTLTEMWSGVPQAFLEILSQHDIVPETIYTDSPKVYETLQGVAAKLNFEVILTPDVPALREAMAALARFTM